MYRLILASASKARLTVLRNAGLHPEVIVSGVDEDAISADSPVELVARLARAKAEAVAAECRPGSSPGTNEAFVSGRGVGVDQIIVGCDSMFEFDGEVYGKPESAQRARERCRRMSGRSGLLHTGHHVIVRRGDGDSALTEVATTQVTFAELSDPEIEAYLATGEPLGVAGNFTIDGYGGAFVERVDGDHTNVIGISLPLFRKMLARLEVRYTDLWH